jgi:segregation and condensation protein B
VVDISQAILEALLFVADEPLTLSEISAATELDEDQVIQNLQELKKYYEQGKRGLLLRMVAGGYQICTRPEYAPFIKRLLGKRERNVLSQAALETLAIIAYKQPITKGEIEGIRGVRIDSVLDRLLDRNLVRETGRMDTPGRPILYATTREFLAVLGLQGLEDLPKIDEE